MALDKNIAADIKRNGAETRRNIADIKFRTPNNKRNAAAAKNIVVISKPGVADNKHIFAVGKRNAAITKNMVAISKYIVGNSFCRWMLMTVLMNYSVPETSESPFSTKPKYNSSSICHAR